MRMSVEEREQGVEGDPIRSAGRAVDHATDPYRWSLPEGADIEPDPLVVRVDVHQCLVIVKEYREGGITGTKVVSARDLRHGLARGLDWWTGILPRADVLWHSSTPGGTHVAVWTEPGVRRVSVRARYGEEPQRLTLPMPGLLFFCFAGGKAPYVYAAKERPKGLEDLLFHCPTYNVFPSGRICVGSHTFPSDPARIPDEFWCSNFSITGDTARGKSHKHPDDVGRLWRELEGRTEYPLEDLVQAIKVAYAARIEG